MTDDIDNLLERSRKAKVNAISALLGAAPKTADAARKLAGDLRLLATMYDAHAYHLVNGNYESAADAGGAS